MTDTDRDAQFWDRIAAKYARDPIKDRAGYAYTLGRTRSYLRAQDQVLELGAGTSSTALELAPGVARYLATDVSAEMVRIGQEKRDAAGVSGPEIEVGTSAILAATGVRFDAVLAHNLIHLVPDMEAALADIAALTKPAGLFISKTPCLGSASLLKRALFRAMIPVMGLFGKAPSVVQFLTVEALDAMVSAAGFEIVETSMDGIEAPRRYIVARRL